jgi:hypothetical protein
MVEFTYSITPYSDPFLPQLKSAHSLGIAEIFRSFFKFSGVISSSVSWDFSLIFFFLKFVFSRAFPRNEYRRDEVLVGPPVEHGAGLFFLKFYRTDAPRFIFRNYQ